MTSAAARRPATSPGDIAGAPPAAVPANAAAIEEACARMAPTWPLDQFIAVNPWWEFRHEPLAEAAARLGHLAGSRLLMPRAWYRGERAAGRLRREHLARVVAAAPGGWTVARLEAALEAPDPMPSRLALVTDRVDAGRDLRRQPAWRDVVTHQVSQHCAAFFDRSQAAFGPDRRDGLYGSWRRQVAAERAPRLLMGARGFGARIAALPVQSRDLIDAATAALGVPAPARAGYYTALLLCINGWAAWCAYERWQARLAGGDDDQLVDLLAIRLAWEWLLYPELRPDAAGQWRLALDGQPVQADEAGWLLQRAVELAYQDTLCASLKAPPAAGAPAPVLEAVFCIDVRSEPYRRALEACDPGIRTRGFAGFFGLPVAYQPLGTALTRPQLPGLLAPAWTVTDEVAADAGELTRSRQRRLSVGERWRQFRSLPGSGFSFVETCGLLYAGKLLAGSLPGRPPRPVEAAGLPRHVHGLRPALPASVGPAGRVALAARVLGAMGLTRDFARLVLIAGHGSQTANNPHAAGLDCGACGGQTGEVNARVLAALLNEPAVRAGLAARDIAIPPDTCFVAGLHNTTTDDVTLYDLDQVPPGHAADVARLEAWLARAGDAARAARAPALGLKGEARDADGLRRAVRRRASDWSEVRPEWGLADNAAFIVAPRSRTRQLDLRGRAFLHDYDWATDDDFAVLELIMTAPMVVTHWINLQYYASTVDPQRYGSGNKVLHNVVGGRLGVFEGNGGDLRIGLPWQSVHDGSRLRHTPLRLSVFIEAPAAAIDGIIGRHAVVRQLVENGWLHLFRIERADGSTWQRLRGQWVAWEAPDLGQPDLDQPDGGSG